VLMNVTDSMNDDMPIGVYVDEAQMYASDAATGPQGTCVPL